MFAFGVGEGIGNIVEMSPDGSTIFSEFTVPLGGGGGIVVRDDGIWQSLFASDIIRHYTRDGVFIEDVSVAESFPEFSGPDDLTSSFTGGFFILGLGERIVEVDIAGNEIAAVSTATLGDGRGLAIDSDVNTQRIFLQVNNEEIYVLSSEFLIQRIVNNLVTFQPIQSTFTFTPNTTGCPNGFVGKFSFDAKLVNVSDQSLTFLAIEVTILTNDNLLQNADGGPGGDGARLTVPQQDGFTDGVLSPDEFVDVPFIICLTQRRPFTFVVDVLGVVDAGADAQARVQLVR